MYDNKNLLFTGCGILKKEIDYLARRNGWKLDSLFLDSSLHVDFNRLEKALTGVLEKNADRPIAVFYGACHPLMEKILSGHHAARTEGQNCIDILLGHEAFTSYLADGAFFLLEDWARRFTEITALAMGSNPDGIRTIFQSEHRYLLAIRTPCSGDYKQAADKASEQSGLPLRWLDTGLDILEQHIRVLLKESGYHA